MYRIYLISGQKYRRCDKDPCRVYDWVENDGHAVRVGHNASETEGHGTTQGTTKYVRTEPNETKEDNLSKQPSC